MPRSRRRKQKKPKPPQGKALATAAVAPPPTPPPSRMRKSWARLWRIINPILVAHALYSLAKDSVLFSRWAHDLLVIKLHLPEHAVEMVRTAGDVVISAYRAIVWPALSWLDAALRDFVFVICIVYGPTMVAGAFAIYRSARGRPGNAIFRAAANRQFYIQSLVSIVVGVRALDAPSTYFYVTALLCFLTPLQFIRHLDYRLPFEYGFKEARETLLWYLVLAGIPFFLFIYPALKAEPHLSAMALAVGASAMLAVSLTLSMRDLIVARMKR